MYYISLYNTTTNILYYLFFYFFPPLKCFGLEIDSKPKTNSALLLPL